MATPAAGIGQQKGPNSSPWQHPTSCRTTNASKIEWIGLQSFASSAIFTLTLTTWLQLLQASQPLFAGEMLPQPAGGRRCFPRVHQIPRPRFFNYGNKQAYFSLAKKKKCVDVMIPVLINKDVFEPSCNDLKFTVQNHNYVCTNLIYLWTLWFKESLILWMWEQCVLHVCWWEILALLSICPRHDLGFGWVFLSGLSIRTQTLGWLAHLPSMRGKRQELIH